MKRVSGLSGADTGSDHMLITMKLKITQSRLQ